jgi:hypothetical protein
MLNDDNSWRQHTWLWDGKKILETTVKAKLYFGTILDESEAASFVITNVWVHMPGFDNIKKAGTRNNEGDKVD